jgi:hypothetical protein
MFPSYIPRRDSEALFGVIAPGAQARSKPAGFFAVSQEAFIVLD